MKHPARHAAVETPPPYVELERAMFGHFAVEHVIKHVSPPLHGGRGPCTFVHPRSRVEWRNLPAFALSRLPPSRVENVDSVVQLRCRAINKPYIVHMCMHMSTCHICTCTFRGRGEREGPWPVATRLLLLKSRDTPKGKLRTHNASTAASATFAHTWRHATTRRALDLDGERGESSACFCFWRDTHTSRRINI